MSAFHLGKIKKSSFMSSLALFISIQIALGVIIFMLPSNSSNRPLAQQGVLDLTSWDVQLDLPVNLDGQWEFYWEKLLFNRDFEDESAARPDLLIKVPNEWNGYLLNGTKLPRTGYATYRLTIQTSSVDQAFALRIPPLSTAYEIYVNDHMLASGGQLGQSDLEHESNGKLQTVEFVSPSDTFNLIIHVSNFEYAKGGMNRSLLLGSTDAIRDHNQGLIYRDFFLIGSLLMAAFYSASMYFMNREQKISLYFGLVCLLFLCRIPLTGSYYLYELIPSATLQLSEWVNYTTFHACILFYALLIREFFPSLFSKRASQVLIRLTVVIIALLIVLPLSIYSRFYLVSDVLGIAMLIYPLYVIMKAAVRKERYAWLVFFGNGMLLALVLLDIVNTELNRYWMG